MVAPIQGIIRNIIKKPEEKCNILSIMHDGFFEELLSKTGHNLYVLVNKMPNWLTKTLDVVDNIKPCQTPKDIPKHISIDAVICNDRIKLYEQSKGLSRLAHAPLIIVDHLDISGLKSEDIHLINKNTGHFQICASNVFGQIGHINYTDIIQYGLEIPENIVPIKDRQNNIVLVGDYTREQQLLSVLKNQFNAVAINSQNHPGSFSEIAKIVGNSKIYLNLSAEPSMSIHTLMAMAQGCVVINHQANSLSKILNGTNGITYSGGQNLLTYLKAILEHQQQIQSISNAAIETIRIQFNQQRFINQWNLIFSQLTNVVYKL